MPPSTEIVRDERTNNTLRVQEIIARDLLPKMRHDQAVDRQILRERRVRLRMDPFNGAVMRVLPRGEAKMSATSGVLRVARLQCPRCEALTVDLGSDDAKARRAHHRTAHPEKRFRAWARVWVPA